MTTVDISRAGTDQVSLDVFQSGSHESSVTLRHDFLDSKKKYHFAITSLSVPLNNTPIFKIPAGGTKEIFRLERRHVGGSINEDLALHTTTGAFPAVPEIHRVFHIRANQKFFDVSSLVKYLANWCRSFNRYWTLRVADGGAGGFNPMVAGYSGFPAAALAGLTTQEYNEGGPYPFIGVKLSADGTLQLVGDSYFWNNFIMRWTREGAALLGFYNQLLRVDRVGGGGGNIAADATHYYISKTNDGAAITNTFLIEATGQILVSNTAQEFVISSSHPIFQSVDQRIKVSVESHMPMASNIAVVDESESVDRTIAEAYFESKLQNEIRFDESGVFDRMTMRAAMYSGQSNMIRKSDINFQWNRLSSAYELKLFRFQLYVTYRVWDSARQRWTLSKTKLDVDPQEFWELSCRFVSDS